MAAHALWDVYRGGEGAMPCLTDGHVQAGEPPKKKKTTRMQRKAMKIANSRKPQTILNSL
jgi:hypothetical protein